MQAAISLLELRETVSAASTYLARGWQPVPIPPRSKAPILKEWQNLRVTRENIPNLFSHGGNIGILLGTPSGGLTDIDLDSTQAIVLATDFLPRTDMIHGRIRKRFSHYWYKTDGLSASEKFVAPDGTCLLELRYTGQTVVPPGRHPSGDLLIWEKGSEPTGIDGIALRPSVIYLAVAALLARYWPEKGSRQQAALAASGLLLRGGLSEEIVKRIIVGAAKAAGDEEWRKRETVVVDTAVNLSAGGATTGGNVLSELLKDGVKVAGCITKWLGFQSSVESVVWGDPEPFDEEPHTGPAFPLEILPEPVRSYVSAQATALQIPVDLAACLVIGVEAAAAAAGGFEIYLNEEWQEPLNLYVAVALPSGERKSPAFRVVTRPLERAESDLIFSYSSEIEIVKVEKDILEAKLREAKTRAVKAQDDNERNEAMAQITRIIEQLRSKKIPSSPRLLADDATSEAVAGLLADHGGRMAVMSTEGGLFETIGGRYADHVPNIDIFLKAYSGDPVRVDRRTRAPEFIRYPSLTMCLTVQPAVIRGLFVQEFFRGRGLLARFLYSIPESIVGYRAVDVPPVPQELRGEWSSLIRKILSFSEVEGQKWEIVLGTEAAATFREFRIEAEARLRPEGDLAAIPDWANKYPGTVARLAGILHLFQHAGEAAPWGIPVDKGTLESAIAIGEYFVQHALLAYHMMGTSPGLEKARRLWAIICSYGLSRFTIRDLHQRRRRSFTMEDLGIALDTLEGRGYVRKVNITTGKKVGRPSSQEYEVNPLACTQNSQNTQNDSDETGFVNSENFKTAVEGNKESGFNTTRDWQEVPQDATLPLGLETYIDLKSGTKYARLPQNNGADRDEGGF